MNQTGNKTYSLKSILEERYLSLLMKKANIGFEKIKGKSTLDKIDYLLVKVNEDVPTLETFVDYRKRLIYKILDAVLENSKNLLHPPNNKRTYLLNEDNVIFINFLLDSYDDGSEDIKNILNGKFSKISIEFRELFCRGLRELASNENTSITQDYVEKLIALKLELGYNETVSKIRDLEGAIDRYAMDFYYKEDSLYVYEQVQEVVQMLIDCIPYTSNPNENLPDIVFENFKENMEKTRMKAKERSDRIKKGWETRRKKYKE